MLVNINKNLDSSSSCTFCSFTNYLLLKLMCSALLLLQNKGKVNSPLGYNEFYWTLAHIQIIYNALQCPLFLLYLGYPFFTIHCLPEHHTGVFPQHSFATSLYIFQYLLSLLFLREKKKDLSLQDIKFWRGAFSRSQNKKETHKPAK